MIEYRVRHDLFQPACGRWRNTHFLVAKKNRNDCLIRSAMRVNEHTEEHTGILPIVKECSEAFSGRPIFLMIYIHSGYDLSMLNENIRDYMAYWTMQGIYWLTRWAQGATDLVSALVSVSQHI